MKPHLEALKRAIADGQAQLVDVRERGEWDAGHLRQATLVPLSDLSAKKAPVGLDKNKELHVHCRSGNRVRQAAPLLASLGYRVVEVREGYDELVREGFERA